MKSQSLLRSALFIALTTLGSLNIQAAAIITDNFTGTGNLSAHTPNVNTPGGSWSSAVGIAATISSNQANLYAFSGGIIPISSNGGYTKPTTLTISAALNPHLITESADWDGVGLGFYSALPPGEVFQNFTGVILHVDGALSLVQINSGYLITVIDSEAYTLNSGTFTADADHTVSYTINTTTGGISGLSLTDSNGTQNYSFSTGVFLNAATNYAGFYAHSASFNTAYVSDFSVAAVPEPSAALLLITAAGVTLLSRKLRRGIRG